jgi:hypothetical protein
MSAEKHHYVPEWYQRRFLPVGAKDNNLWYLDCLPQPIPHLGGYHYEKNPRRRGPDVSFHEPGLYMLHFGKLTTDVMERDFFGEIDRIGQLAVTAMSDFVFTKTASPNIQHLVQYLDAQKMRTPKGIDYLKAVAKTNDHETAVHLIRYLSQMHVTIWMEGVWEVFRLDHTKTKLLLTDHPVTCYNRHIAPGDAGCKHPFEPGIDLIGTQTLFPLGPERLLVISNLQFVRNHWINGKSLSLNKD